MSCVLAVCAVGDPVPDVGGASLLHYEAALVAVPGDVGRLLRRHRFHHVPGHSQTPGMHHAEVMYRCSVHGEEKSFWSVVKRQGWQVERGAWLPEKSPYTSLHPV